MILNFKAASIAIATTTVATGAFAGVAAPLGTTLGATLGTTLGTTLGAVLGTMVSLPFGIEASAGGSAIVAIAAVALMAGICIVHHKKSR
jgi:hypothetical protein